MNSEMYNMSFYIKLNTKEFIKRNLVSGPIWLELDDQTFPLVDWHDFPIVVLGFWLTNLKILISNKSLRCECRFMDGTYKFEVTVVNCREWNINLIRDENLSIWEKKIAPKIFTDSVISASETVLDYCKQQNWDHPDLSELEKEMLEVKRLLPI